MAAILWRGDELRCNSLLSLARTLKYEEVYLHGYGSPSEAQQGLCKHFEFYTITGTYTVVSRGLPASCS